MNASHRHVCQTSGPQTRQAPSAQRIWELSRLLLCAACMRQAHGSRCRSMRPGVTERVPEMSFRMQATAMTEFLLLPLGQRRNWRLALMMAACDRTKINKLLSKSHCRNPHQGIQRPCRDSSAWSPPISCRHPSSRAWRTPTACPTRSYPRHPSVRSAGVRESRGIGTGRTSTFASGYYLHTKYSLA